MCIIINVKTIEKYKKKIKKITALIWSRNIYNNATPFDQYNISSFIYIYFCCPKLLNSKYDFRWKSL